MAITKPEDAIEKIRKKYGKTSIAKFSEKITENVDVIPTGSISLDAALEIGGYPMGRMVAMNGYEGSGKSTLALHAIAEAQKLEYFTAFIDTEYALDVRYARSIGVDVDNMYVSQPNDAEEALGIMEALISSETFGLVVLDSVASMVPKRELDGESGDSHIGLLARLMSQAGRRLTGIIGRTNTLVLLINQYRMNINSMGYGPSKTTPGGRAMGYYPSLILDVARKGTNKTSNESVGNRIAVKVVKSRVGSPYRVAEFDIDFGVGISRAGELIEYGLKAGMLKKSGAWYKTADGETLAQGKEGMKVYLDENGEYAKELESTVREYVKRNLSIDIGSEDGS